MGLMDVVDSRTVGDMQRCPVSHHDGTWTIWGNAEARKAAEDSQTFSSRVSRHLSIPNALDGEEHQRFRRLIDRYLSDAAVNPLFPDFLDIARTVVDNLPRGEIVDAVTDVGSIVAVRCQSHWLGWSRAHEETLLTWMDENRAAARSGARSSLAAVARRFDAIIRQILDEHRALPADSSPTAALIQERIDQRSLRTSEIVAILRNWTSGDLGSIAASIGVVAYSTATRNLADNLYQADDETLDAAIDELLRIDDPFISNRRVTTREVELGGVRIPAHERVIINWTAANRDRRAFDDPDAFAPQANREKNLVYGAGPHACPGRRISTLEIRAGLIALLEAGFRVAGEPQREAVPGGGFSYIPIVLGT